MKNVFRFILVLALSAASLMVVAAQDVEVTVDPATSGVFTQEISEGAFVDNGDDTFTLTINDVSEFTDWVFIAPNVDAGEWETLFLSSYWSAIDGLEATATLRTTDVTAILTLSAPTYNSEEATLSYTASIDNIFYTQLTVAEDSKDDPAIAEAFSDATLTIIADADFVQGLNDGEAVAAFRAPPGTSKSCSKPSGGSCSNLTSVGDLR